MNNTSGGRPNHSRNRLQQRRGGGSNNNRRSSHSNNGRRNNNSGMSAANATSARNKYLDKAKEAIGFGDKVAAENFFQHADHYARIVIEQEEKNVSAPRKPENKPEAAAAGNGNSSTTESASAESENPAPAQESNKVEETEKAPKDIPQTPKAAS